jgi:hypothetical protein
MPDTYEEAWRRADEEYAARERERIAALIEQLVADHWWLGGLECSCGTHVAPTRNSHTRHLLEVALELDNVGP